MRFIGALIVWIIIGIIAYFVVAYTGAYAVGADVPHWRITEQAIGFLRDHTTEKRAADIKPPPLDNPALVKEGAEHYAEMCTECHLAPGMTSSELRDGLYPRPPNLTRFAPDPAESFWIIKHGLKMTGMPAWGKTHDDRKLWAIVAFLQKQPKMSVSEYRALTANASAMEGMEEGQAPAPAGTAMLPPGMSAASAPAHAGTVPAPSNR
ncbi:MAG TPA: cytochrome c [Rhodanobacteraceae bacterium]|nr:cytochrome c [Rhodanobacteraceae bacterium]